MMMHGHANVKFRILLVVLQKNKLWRQLPEAEQSSRMVEETQSKEGNERANVIR
jgi:hypothetical protein